VLSGANWEAYAAKANTREWWTVVLWYDDEAAGKFIYLSEHDFVNSGLKFHGVITNQPTIRESVDFKRCTSKVSNVTVDCQNIQYQGLPLSNELFGGSKKYINRTVEIFSSQIHHNFGGMGFLQIFSGRLTNVVPDLDKGTFTLTFENKTPFDLVSIPANRNTYSNGFYTPVVYGDFTANDSKPSSEDYITSEYLYPVEVYRFNDVRIKTTSPRTYASGAQLHIYDEGSQAFIPLVDPDGNYQDDTEAGPTLLIDSDFGYGWKLKPYNAIDGAGNAAFINLANAIDKTVDDTTAGTASTVDITWQDANAKIVFQMDTSDVPLTTYDIEIVWGTDADLASATLYKSDSSDGTGGTQVGSAFADVTTGTYTESFTVTSEQLASSYFIIFLSAIGTHNVSIYDFRIIANAGKTAADITANNSFRANLKKLYVGANGLQDNGWINGATDISEVHDIHRDLLHRFGGITGTPEGWTDINTEKANWDVRLWQHKPEKLTKILEKLQYEGCFVYHTRATGAGAYLVLKSSYASGDVDMTLTNDRVKNLKITHIAPDDMVTKWEVSSNPHPADNSRYLEQETASSANRANWGFTGDENTETVELDYLVNTAAGAVDMSGFTDYREQVVGTVVQTVKFDLAYSKDMLLEVGDIIQFSGIATDPFGDLNTIYWAVTKTSRSVGKMNITALEVG